jgi:acyl carrier protein
MSQPMTSEELAEKVQVIIAASLGVQRGDVRPEASFRGDLGTDSLDVIEMVLAMEKEFEIQISDEAARQIKTVQDAIDFVANHVS